jgi:ribosomal protein L11 methyltransferase
MGKSWWEIQVQCAAVLEESMFWRLETFGCEGMVSERKGDTLFVTVYYPQAQAQVLDLAALALSIRQDAICMGQEAPVVTWSLIGEQDWSTSWKDKWETTSIGDRFLIHPIWLPEPEAGDRVILRLEPGVAFGTGAHATTQLCLEALEMRLGESPETQTIVDVGCGSGILSVGALLLGARQLYAVDNDPLAIKATKENIVLNHLDPIKLLVEEGSVETLVQMVPMPVEGIVCNILANVIVDLIPQWEPIVKPTTWGILSGILLDQAKMVAEALEENGWFVAALWKRGDWVCLNIRRL